LAKFNPQTKHQVDKLKRLMLCFLFEKFLTHQKVLNPLVDAVFSWILQFLFFAKVKPITVLSGAAFCWDFFLWKLWPNNTANNAVFHAQTSTMLE